MWFCCKLLFFLGGIEESYYLSECNRFLFPFITFGLIKDALGFFLFTYYHVIVQRTSFLQFKTLAPVEMDTMSDCAKNLVFTI